MQVLKTHTPHAPVWTHDNRIHVDPSQAPTAAQKPRKIKLPHPNDVQRHIEPAHMYEHGIMITNTRSDCRVMTKLTHA